MVRLNRQAPDPDQIAFDRYLEGIVRAEPGAPIPLPQDPIDLTTFAYQMHSPELIARSQPAYAERLLRQLLEVQKEHLTVTAHANVLTSRAANPAPRGSDELRFPARVSWASLAALLVGVVVISLLIRNYPENGPQPVVMAPSSISSPAATTDSTADGANAELVWTSIPAEGAMVNPTGLEIAPDGTIWIADGRTGTFQIFGSDGAYLDSWGTAGDGNGEFNFSRNPLRPDDIAGDVSWDSEGNIYVLDPGNYRIQKFGPDRTFLMAWGLPGGGPGQFSGMFSIAVGPDDTVAVLDDTRGTVQMFDSNGSFLDSIGVSGSNPGQVRWSGGIKFDGDGNLWIADLGNNRVVSFDPNGTFRFSFGESGSGRGQFNYPVDLAFDAVGNVYVTEYGNSRIQTFTADGIYLFEWVTQGNPVGLSVSGDDVFVTDQMTGSLSKYAVSLPAGPPSGQLVVARLDSSSPHLSSAFEGEPGASVSPLWTTADDAVRIDMTTSVSVAPDGTIWVPDGAMNTIHIFDSGGGHLEDWGEPGSGPGQFAFALERSRVFRYLNIASHLCPGWFLLRYHPGNHRIQKFAADRTFVMEFGGTGVPESRINEFGAAFLIGMDEIAVVDLRSSTGDTFDLAVYSLDGLFRRRVNLTGNAPIAFAPDGTYWAVSGTIDNQSRCRALR